MTSLYHQNILDNLERLRMSNPDLFEEEEQEEDILNQMQEDLSPIEEDIEITPEEQLVQQNKYNNSIEYYNSWRNGKQRELEEEKGIHVRRGGEFQSLESLEEYTLNDIENPNHFLHDEWNERSQLLIEGIAGLGQDPRLRKSGDIFEYLRDEKYSTTRTIQRAMQNREWTPEIMEHYRWLRQVFDKAKLGGSNQVFEATKDIAIDLVADPMNLITGVLSVFSGGVGGAAFQAGARGVAASAQLAGRAAQANRVRRAMVTLRRKPTWQNTMQGISMAATEGSVDAALINTATQLSELQTGIRQSGDNFSVKELGVATGAGLLLGGALGGGIATIGNSLTRRAYAKTTGDKDAVIPNKIADPKTGELRRTTPQDMTKMRQASSFYNKAISLTFGKATTAFKAAAKDSPALTKVISLFRADAFRDIFDFSGALAGKSELDAPLAPSYNTRAEMKVAKLKSQAEKYLSMVKNIGQGWAGTKSFWNIRIDPIVNRQLRLLLSSKDGMIDENTSIEKLYRMYFKDIDDNLDGDLLTGDALEAAIKQNRHIKVEGQELAPETVAAAFHMRKALNDAHAEGANIKVLRPDDVKETTSLFNMGSQFIEGYFPRVWKYSTLSKAEAQADFIDDLINTSHSDPQEGFKTIWGRYKTDDGSEATIKIELDKDTNQIGVKVDGEFKDLTDADIVEQMSKIESWSKDPNNPNTLWTNRPDYDVEIILKDQGTIDQNAFPEFMQKHNVTSFRQRAKQILPKGSTDEEILKEAKRLKATAIVDQMVNRKYNLTGPTKGISPDRTGFAQHRAFTEISDDRLLELDLIEDNVEDVFRDYMFNIGRSIERTALFGNNKEQFHRRWVRVIEKELLEKWGDSPKARKRIKDLLGEAGMGDSEGLTKLFTYVTGLESKTVSGPLAHALDTAKVAFRLSGLPLATVSSITEPMIALARADLADTPAYIKSFAHAGGKGFQKIFQRTFRRMSVAAGYEVKGFADLRDDHWMEVMEAGLAMEQALEQRLAGLYGETHTNWGRWVSNQFFQYNLLMPWTQGVQMGAYNFANARITRILGELDSDTNFYGQKLSRSARNRRKDELFEIGIDPAKGVAEYRAVDENTGQRKYFDEEDRFSMEKWKESDYFDQTVVPASSTFAREIILNPSVAEANTPLWFKSPWGSLLVQFAGYPTAFNNIVLKGMLRSVARRPLVNGPKVVAATTLMTGTAMLGNALRSNGESLKEEDPTIVLMEAARRWGALGPGEVLWKYAQSTQYNAPPAAAGAKSFLGPAPSKVLDMLLYRQTLPEAVVRTIPGYAALSPDTKQALRDWGRRREGILFRRRHTAPSSRTGEGLFRGPTGPGAMWRGEHRSGQALFASGGLVDVDNATPEPDERIDRMTGLPYNIQAGTAFQDEEDRIGFATGSLVDLEEDTRELSEKERIRFELQKNPMYKYITKDEDEYATLDSTPIVLYGEEDFPSLDIEKTFYASLPENSRRAQLEAYRNSKTIGLLVSEEPSVGNIRLAGKIKFKNLLSLNIDEVTPSNIEEQLSVIKSGNVLSEQFFTDSVIEEIKYQLAVRDDALEADTNVTEDAKELVEQSKSFILRHGLLKLGYDAIKYNNGYVLLRENQFMPTEILGRERANKGGLMTALNSRRKKYDIGGISKRTSPIGSTRTGMSGMLYKVLANRYLKGYTDKDQIINAALNKSNIPVLRDIESKQGTFRYTRGIGKTGQISASYNPEERWTPNPVQAFRNPTASIQGRWRFSEGGDLESIEKTEEVTRVGRPIWKAKKGDKEVFYSERTVTFPINEEETKWVTFPSINEEGQSISEDELRAYVMEHGPIDPLTGEEFPVFSDSESAVNYARERSPSLRREGYAEGGDLESDEGDDALLNQLRENAYNRLKIEDRERAERELKFFNDAVVLAESSNNWNATTGIEGNTASGGYQITDDQAITAANRILNTLARMEGKYNKDNKGAERKEYMESENVPRWLRDVSLGNLNVIDVSPRRQQILFEGNMFEAEGSDEVVAPLLRGDRSAMDNFYFDFHHTNPDAEGQGDIRGNWDRALKEIDRQYATLP